MKKFFIFVPVRDSAIAASCDEPLAAGRVGRTARGGSTHLVPAATVTTGAQPHGQQQLARDLEVECAVMGQRCRSKFRRGAAMLCKVPASAWLVLVWENCLGFSVGYQRAPGTSDKKKNNWYQRALLPRARPSLVPRDAQLQAWGGKPEAAASLLQPVSL